MVSHQPKTGLFDGGVSANSLHNTMQPRSANPAAAAAAAAAAAVSEALTVSTGYKRPSAEGAFIHSDTYWGYEWWEGEDSGVEIGDWEDDEGVHSEEPSQEEQQVQQQQQQAPVLRKRQRLTAETAA
jgi:hypothetical protein